MSWAELVAAAEAVRVDAVAREPRLRAAPLAAIGWATVDHERAQQELDDLLAARCGRARARALGGNRSRSRARRLRLAARPRPPSRDAARGAVAVLLEPDTEGRVAAFLARFGEGVGVVYLGSGPGQAGELVRGGPAWGPHVVFEAPR